MGEKKITEKKELFAQKKIEPFPVSNQYIQIPDTYRHTHTHLMNAIKVVDPNQIRE